MLPFLHGVVPFNGTKGVQWVKQWNNSCNVFWPLDSLSWASTSDNHRVSYLVLNEHLLTPVTSHKSSCLMSYSFSHLCFVPEKLSFIFTFNFIYAMTKRCVNCFCATMISSSSAAWLSAAGCAINTNDLFIKVSDREKEKVHLLVSSHFSITSGRKYLTKKIKPRLYFLEQF